MGREVTQDAEKGTERDRESAHDPELVAKVAAAVRRHWDELDLLLANGRPDGRAAEDGRSLGRARAAMLDGILRDLFASAVEKTGFRDPIAIAAVGSYGRDAVALRSDADVRLIVRAGARSHEAAAKIADALLYPLWDAGLSVGHQVIDAKDVIDLAQHDLATATTLLDLRTIAGEGALVEDLQERAYAGLFSEGELERFVTRLEEETAARHARFGGSVYLLEPDVKSGAGGLRDVDIASWAARARYRIGSSWQELVRVGVLVPREAKEIALAEELLWRVRNRLHAHAKRKSDRLTFDQQEAIAIELGYLRTSEASEEKGSRAEGGKTPSEPPLGADARARAAERLMQDYFGHARVVTRSREALLLRATPPKRRGKPVEVDLGGGVRLFDGQVTVDPGLLSFDPALALRAYAACIQKKAPILPFARDAIARAAADTAWAERLRDSKEAARLFVDLLCTVAETPLRRGSIAGELHEVGLLLAMIPEFQPVTGRVHHDVYHVYTVDVHSVAAVDCLRALCRGDLAHERPLASRLAAEIARPVPIFLATLLHDVGKGYPDETGSRKNHSIVGADLCSSILPRLGVSGDEAQEVRSLVKNHLLMYHVATRRDLDDPATTTDFSAQVQGREGLRDLYLLTVADITTTSPTAMTSWKARMLDELYFASDAYLAGEEGDRGPSSVDVARKQRVKDAATSLWTGKKPELVAFVDSMPERYVLANAPEAIVAHARVALERHRTKTPVHAALVPSRHPEVSELCVVADDAPGLLARIAAAITASRLEVLGAQVYSRPRVPLSGSPPSQRSLEDDPAQTEAVDLFWVRDGRGNAEGVANAMPRLARDLEAVITGATEPSALLSERIGGASRWAERPSPAVLSEVVVDDRASPRHTVIEVFAKDRPGLLYNLARVLHELGLSIALSKINTEGTKVADVFYVNELDGSKVAPGPRFKAVRDALLAAVTEGHLRVSAANEGNKGRV